MGSKVLVIGGAGFIGSYVVEQLLAEDVDEILVYDNLCRGTMENLSMVLTDKRVRVERADILQTDVLDDAMVGKDYVFHLAALWLLHCHEYPRSAFDVNIRGTFNVLEACVKHKVKKLIYSSSASVYGDAVEIPMTENHPYNNETFYGATKIAGEQMCKAFRKRYGLNYVGLRYMNVYGKRQDTQGAYTAIIWKALSRIKEGLPPIIYGDGSQTYDFVHVEDVAMANIYAMKSPANDGFYNIGTGIGTTVKELVQQLIEITDYGLNPIYEAQGQTFVTNRVGSIGKALDCLGFEAIIGLREGLERTIGGKG